MKKLISFIVLTGMVLFLGLGQPATISQAASSSASETELMQASKTITVRQNFLGNIKPPDILNYDDGTWVGTLNLITHWYDGTRTNARYSGTVYCFGNCPIPPADENY